MPHDFSCGIFIYGEPYGQSELDVPSVGDGIFDVPIFNLSMHDMMPPTHRLSK